VLPETDAVSGADRCWPGAPNALLAPERDDFADVLEGQVERRLTKLLDELAGLGLVARDRQLIVNRQAHIVSLTVIVQRTGQRVTHEMELAAQRLVARRG
jgi:hypothetical protein